MNETEFKNNIIDDYCKDCARYNECNLVINNISEQTCSMNKVYLYDEDAVEDI